MPMRSDVSLNKKKRDWPVIAAWLSGVALAVFYVIWGIIRGETFLTILLIVVVIAVTAPFAMMFWLRVAKWLGYRR